jgi:hypothetical protein
LLASRAGESLPDEVARHLRGCRRCRGQYRRLRRLDQELEQDTPIAVPPARREELLRRLEPRPAGGSSGIWGRLLACAALVLLGLGLGWLLARPQVQHQGGGGEQRSAVAVDERLMPRFVEHHVNLAAAREPAEQVGLFQAMAQDLRGEALRLAGPGRPEDLALLANLYGRVLRHGLAPCSRLVPEPRRRQLVPGLVQQLCQVEAEVAGAAGRTPLLQPMSRAARDVGAGLLADADPNPGPPDEEAPSGALPGSTPALLALLVTSSLRLTEADDPLYRASCCGDVADQMALAIQLACTRGDAPQALAIRRALADVVERGVQANLQRVRRDEPGNPRLAEVAGLIDRASRAVAGLERSLGPGQTQQTQVDELEKTLKDLEKALRDLSRDKKVASGKPREREREHEREREKEHEHDKEREVRGNVVRLDLPARSLVLLVRDRGQEVERTYRLADGLRLLAGSQERPLTLLRPGTRIRGRLRDADTLAEIRWDSSSAKNR